MFQNAAASRYSREHAELEVGGKYAPVERLRELGAMTVGAGSTTARRNLVVTTNRSSRRSRTNGRTLEGTPNRNHSDRLGSTGIRYKLHTGWPTWRQPTWRREMRSGVQALLPQSSRRRTRFRVSPYAQFARVPLSLLARADRLCTRHHRRRRATRVSPSHSLSAPVVRATQVGIVPRRVTSPAIPILSQANRDPVGETRPLRREKNRSA